MRPPLRTESGSRASSSPEINRANNLPHPFHWLNGGFVRSKGTKDTRPVPRGCSTTSGLSAELDPLSLKVTNAGGFSICHTSGGGDSSKLSPVKFFSPASLISDHRLIS